YTSIEGLIGTNSIAGGASVDLWATEKIGVFLRITVRDNKFPTQGDMNLVESDWSLGAVFQGPVASRPDDSLGVAWGLMKGPFAPLGATSSTEQVIEVYYRFVLEDGKLQITPSAQFILDPGAGSFTDPDLLVLIGLRVHVPF
ncbi:MAG: carbohydrate porin, partial [Planctomycetota bacterium]